MNELIAFLKRELVLRYPWTEDWKPSKEVRQGLKWLENKRHRNVGSFTYEKVVEAQNVSALLPQSISADDLN